MDLHNKTIKLCEKYHIKPARSKGQNFLIEEDVFDRIVEEADLCESDTVLEVGPGLGFMTEKLAKKVKKVIAVELDDELVKVLKIRMKENDVENVEVVNENILDLSLRGVGATRQSYELNDGAKVMGLPRSARNDSFVGDYKIVANLPYNITSVFLRKFLTAENKPTSLTLMLQKEVAERITAKNGKMSLLAVSIQFYAQAKILFNVSADLFYPSPKVDSAVIKIDTSLSLIASRVKKDDLLLDEKDFFRLVKHGFSSKRKMLKKNLSGGLCLPVDKVVEILKKAGLSEKVRAEELSVNDWVRVLEEI